MKTTFQEKEKDFPKLNELIQLIEDTVKWVQDKDLIQKAQKWNEENKDNFKKLPDLSEEVLKLISERDNFLKYPELIKEIQKITEIDDIFLEYTEAIKKAQRLFKEVQILFELNDNLSKYTDDIKKIQIWIELYGKNNPFSLFELLKEQRRIIEENESYLKFLASFGEVKKMIEEKKANPNYIFLKLDEINNIITSIFIPKFEQLKKDIVENIEDYNNSLKKIDNFFSKRIKKINEITIKNDEILKKNIEKINEGSDERIPYIDYQQQPFPKLAQIDKIDFEKLFKMYSACGAMLSNYGVWKFWVGIIESAIFTIIVAFSLFSIIVPDKLFSVIVAFICTLIAYILDKTLFTFLKNKILYRRCNKIFVDISVIYLELEKLQQKN